MILLADFPCVPELDFFCGNFRSHPENSVWLTTKKTTVDATTKNCQAAGTLASAGELTRSANTFARAITAAFAQGATGAKSFDTVLKSLALRLSSLSVSMALKPAIGALAGGFGALGGLSAQSAAKPIVQQADQGSRATKRQGRHHRDADLFPHGSRRRWPRGRGGTGSDHAACARA